MRTLYVAWQDQSPNKRRWYPIGRLTYDQRRYQFGYTKGARRAQREAGFSPLPSFPDLRGIYQSAELFPVFSNRVPPVSRPDYPEYITYLSLPQDRDDPMALLARSGGKRATDSLEVFPCPELGDDGLYHIHFFVHGLSHMPPASIERTESLSAGEQLFLMWDYQNPHDNLALALRTPEKSPGDMHIIGYCPRYLVSDVHKLLQKGGPSSAVVKVERINPAPAPVQFRVLCNITMQWTRGFKPFDGTDFRMIATPAAVMQVAA